MVPIQQSSMQLPRVLFIVYWKTPINFIHWSWMVPTLRGWNALRLLELCHCSDSAAKNAQKWLHTSPNLLHLSTEAPSKGPDIAPHLGSCQHTVLREQIRARSVPPYYLCCFYHQRCSRRASYTITDLPSHPSYSLFSLMHCGRRFNCTTRLLNPQAVRRFSS